MCDNPYHVQDHSIHKDAGEKIGGRSQTVEIKKQEDRCLQRWKESCVDWSSWISGLPEPQKGVRTKSC